MEEDNAGDIVKWLYKDSTRLDCSSGQVKVTNEHLHTKLWQPLDFASEPFLIVCEKIKVQRSDEHKNSLTMQQSNKELLLSFQTEKECDHWMLKLMTCSHRIVQAEYEQVLYKRFTQPLPASTTARISNNFGYFLTSPYTREQLFSLSQSHNFPTRQIKCQEIMYECKLSMLVPQEMLRHSSKWATELRDELLDKLWGVKNAAIVETLHTAIRHLNSNIEVYTQASEFLASYAGPSFSTKLFNFNFGPSCEKFRVSFLFVPTNLHVQTFHVDGRLAASFLTVGAIAALPLRFSSGGLYKIRNKFSAALGSIALDHTNENRFHSRRQILLAMKRKIGELSRNIDVKWHIASDGKTDEIDTEIFSEIRQMHEQITDMVNSFPNIFNLVDSLCEGGLAQLQHKGAESVPRDTLRNQLDRLQDQRECEQSVRGAVHSTLDALHGLTASLLSGQALALVQSLRKPSDCQTFFHLQLRSDALLSMVVTLVTTSLLTALYGLTTDIGTFWAHSPPLLEDAFEMWHQFSAVVSFRFVKMSSSVLQNCVPQIDGFRTALNVSIPIHPREMERLPKRMANEQWFRPKVTFWNVGINHEASLAASIGDISLEEEVNRNALRQTVEHCLLLNSAEQQIENAGLIEQLLAELQQTVSSCPSKKNWAIFTQVMALNSAVGGVPVISCKSGKDRTSMGITLDEGRILRECCGVSNQQMAKMVECLRRNGVRRENCRKNAGKPFYSFSPFQLGFLPPPFRPPSGTFSNIVSS
uniref:PH domain-containing protein n=1 Tax=Globodera pallida TaxID=36090 RepID=A0A183C0F5_GLOPA